MQINKTSQSINQSINFGWKQPVHKHISRKFAININEKLPESLHIDVNEFVKCVLNVDKELSLGRVKEHFADINNRHKGDAIDAFWLNYQNAINAHKEGIKAERDHYLARAFHFLQDSLCAVHIEPQCNSRHKSTQKFHDKFETLGNSFVMPYIDNNIPTKKCSSTNLEKKNEFIKQKYEDMLKENKKMSTQLKNETISMVLAVSKSINNTITMNKMVIENFLANIS